VTTPSFLFAQWPRASKPEEIECASIRCLGVAPPRCFLLFQELAGTFPGLFCVSSLFHKELHGLDQCQLVCSLFLGRFLELFQKRSSILPETFPRLIESAASQETTELCCLLRNAEKTLNQQSINIEYQHFTMLFHATRLTRASPHIMSGG
jgi:hypothetical protein